MIKVVIENGYADIVATGTSRDVFDEYFSFVEAMATRLATVGDMDTQRVAETLNVVAVRIESGVSVYLNPPADEANPS